MGPSLRTFELADWARSRKLSAADEQQLRAVFQERDDLRRALEEVLVDVEVRARLYLLKLPHEARQARVLLEETAP